MNTDAGMMLEPQALPCIEKSELARLEGFGNNCEFGLMLRRIGFEDGMLFRWASILPQVLLATLRADFENLYEFDNLVPVSPVMVRDLHYGMGWHTQMYSSLREGTLVFNECEAARRVIHAREASKIAYLVDKLRRKFEHPSPVFVIKANGGIPERILEDIHYQLYRRVTSSRFLLLEVCGDPARAGTVESLDRNRMRGYLNHLAPDVDLYDRDDFNWIRVLKQALAYSAEPLIPSTSAPLTTSPPQQLVLPFPTDATPDPLTPLLGDLRGGMPWLIAGNPWCRMVDEKTYRLHATRMNAEATALRWTGVYLPPESSVTISAWCAIPDSLPVRATLEIAASDGLVLRNEQIFEQVEQRDFSLARGQRIANPLTVSLSVEPLRPLRAGERAVIDLDQIIAAPANPTRWSEFGRHGGAVSGSLGPAEALGRQAAVSAIA